MHKDKKRGGRLVEADGGIREFYSNNVTMCCTASDIRMAFGQLVPVGGNTASEWPGQIGKKVQLTFEIEQRVAITTSWYEAKLFAQLLMESVAAFEQKNGEIKKQEMP